MHPLSVTWENKVGGKVYSRLVDYRYRGRRWYYSYVFLGGWDEGARFI
jgi:hypothetical protein